MYSLACRTPGIIPREYCSPRDRGRLKRAPREAWALLGPLRQALPLREKWESNLARGAPPRADAPPPKNGTAGLSMTWCGARRIKAFLESRVTPLEALIRSIDNPVAIGALTGLAAEFCVGVSTKECHLE